MWRNLTVLFTQNLLVDVRNDLAQLDAKHRRSMQADVSATDQRTPTLTTRRTPTGYTVKSNSRVQFTAVLAASSSSHSSRQHWCSCRHGIARSDHQTSQLHPARCQEKTAKTVNYFSFYQCLDTVLINYYYYYFVYAHQHKACRH